MFIFSVLKLQKEKVNYVNKTITKKIVSIYNREDQVHEINKKEVLKYN